MNEKIQKVKNILHSLGNSRIEPRESERVKHNERVRSRNEEKREKVAHKQFKKEVMEEKK